MLKIASTAAPAHQKLLSNCGISEIILQVYTYECKTFVLRNLAK